VKAGARERELVLATVSDRLERIRISMSRIAERSSQALINPSRSPSPERRAEKVMRTGTVCRRAGQHRLMPVDARGCAGDRTSIGSSGNAAPTSADQVRPMARGAATPVISSAARLNAVIRCSRSSAISPVPTD